MPLQCRILQLIRGRSRTTTVVITITVTLTVTLTVFVIPSFLTLTLNKDGDGLGWHFDRGSFGVNLVIQQPLEGGNFEYHPNTRTTEDSHNPNLNHSLPPPSLSLTRSRTIAVTLIGPDPGRS